MKLEVALINLFNCSGCFIWTFFLFQQHLTFINVCTVLGGLAPITLSMGIEPINDGRSPNIGSEAGENKDLLGNPSRDATALNHHNYQQSSPSNNFGSALHLDLSLRRCQPNDFEERVAEGRATLKHSSASAFTRCVSDPWPLICVWILI